MPNPYYTFTDTFVPGSRARSGDIDREYQAVETGFDLLPADAQAINGGRAAFAGDSTGTGNAYEVSMPTTRTANTNGDEVIFIADKANTGAVTLNVDAIGAQALVRADSSALVANDLQAGLMYIARWDDSNTRYQLIGPSASYLTNTSAAAAAAAASETAAGLSETAAGLSETNSAASEAAALISQDAAEDWAINPEDVLVPAASGGNEVDEYSAYHWAQKASGASGLPVGSEGETLYYNTGVGWDNTTIISIDDAVNGAAITHGGFAAITTMSGGFILGDTAHGIEMFEVATTGRIVNRNHAGPLELRGEDTGGVERLIASFNPDAGPTLYHTGFATFDLAAQGQVHVLAATGTDAVLGLYENGNQKLRLFFDQSADQIRIRAPEAATTFVIEEGNGTNTAATFDPSGSQVVYHANAVVTRTQTSGIDVYDGIGDNPLIGLYQDGGSRNAYIQAASASGLIIRSQMHGFPVQIQGEDAGGTNRDLVYGDPDAATSIYFAGTARVSTLTNGAEVLGQLLDLDNSGAATATTIMARNSAGGVTLNVNLTSGDAQIGQVSGSGTAEDVWASFARNGAVELFYDGTSTLATATDGIDVTGSFVDLAPGANTTSYFRVWNTNGGVGLRAEATTGDGALTELNGTGGVAGLFISMVSGAETGLHYSGSEVARTLAAASGGFEVNNTSTGGGFERVLTTSDLGGSNGPVLHVVLAADEVYTSDQTVGTITGFSYAAAAATRYRVRAVLWVSSGTAGTNPGFRLKLEHTGTTSGKMGRVLEYRDSGLVRSSRYLPDGSTLTGITAGSTADECMVVLECFVETITSGTLSLQGAQSTSNATSTNLEEGSYIEIWEE